MKFTVKQEDFLKALTIATKAIGARVTHPILSNVLIKVKDSTLTLISSNLSETIKYELETLETFQDGEITIPGKILTTIISKTKDSEVLTFSLEDTTLIIKHNTGKISIQGLSSDDFPEVDLSISEDSITLERKLFLKGIKSTVDCSATDETKRVLTGINIKKHDEQITFASTDGHRLSVITFGETPAEDTEIVELTISAQSLAKVSKIISDSQVNQVHIYIKQDNVLFDIDNCLFDCRRFSDPYPNYPQLMPKEFQRELLIDNNAFSKAIERITAISASGELVRLSFNNDDEFVTVKLIAKDLGQATESVAGKITCLETDLDSDFTIGFNFKYLLTALKTLEDNVKICFNGATQPVIIKDLSEYDQVSLIMPIQIKD